ncbi:MAG: HEAT repeat domain-containing protein [Oscillochloridaceae bacterium umkhey_bin13]
MALGSWLARRLDLRPGEQGSLFLLVSFSFGQGWALVLADTAALTLLLSTLGASALPNAYLLAAGEVHYAIELLAEQQPEQLVSARPALLAHPDPLVRRTVLDLIATGRLHGDTNELVRLVTDESDPATQAAALIALCAHARTEAVDHVTPLVNHPDQNVSRSAVLGLLRHGGLLGTLAGGRRLLELAESPCPDERILAAGIVAELDQPDYLYPLRPLLHDPNPDVRRAMLIAAGRCGAGQDHVVQSLLNALADPATTAAAAYGLELAGPAAVPAMRSALATAPQPVQVALVTALGRILGSEAEATLCATLDHPYPLVRQAVGRALLRRGYRATGSIQAQIWAQLPREIAAAGWLLAALRDLEHPDDELLREALAEDLHQCCERILDRLACASDPQAITNARLNLRQGTPEQQANALEIIDVLLPVRLKAALLPLFERLPPAQQYERLQSHTPQPLLGRERRLAELVAAPEDAPLSAWSRTCAQASQQTPSPATAASLRATMQQVAVLRRTDLFARTPGTMLAELAQQMTTIALPAGSTVFAQGDPGDALYIISSGSVHIHLGAQTLNTLGSGALFGEMALIDTAPRAASATTSTATNLLRLSRQDFTALCASRPEVLRQILRTMTRNLRINLATLSTLREQTPS